MFTTDAVVLSLQSHSDKAHILHTYTRAHGRVNYKVYGIGRRNAIGLYHPFNLIQITTSTPFNEQTGAFPTLRTACLSYVPQTLSTDPYKKTIALFLSEIIYHTLLHPMPDENMFEYLRQAILLLDSEGNQPDFHLQFLIGFASQLGFGIDEHTHPHLICKPDTRSQRQQQLRELCTYFSEHIDHWQLPRSLDILMDVFD